MIIMTAPDSSWLDAERHTVDMNSLEGLEPGMCLTMLLGSHFQSQASEVNGENC